MLLQNINNTINNNNTPPGAGHRVVVEGLSTCQGSHLTEKPGAGQGVTVAGDTGQNYYIV